MTEIEKEVSEAIAADPNYPLGEPDALKWAVAWRLLRDRNGINANASNMPGEEIDGWMLGWFANCMASAPPSMLMAHNNVSDQCDQDAAKAWWNKPVMVDVTQADRDAAASVAVLTEMRELILSGRADHHAEPFARHRIAAAQAERAAVVAWLEKVEKPGGRQPHHWSLAAAIEVGEHHA